MPSVPVYIRKDDYESWLRIKDKSQFISDAINKAPAGGFSEVPVTHRGGQGVAPLSGVYITDLPESTYAVVVRDTGVIVKKNLTKIGADKFVDLNNMDGDLVVVQQ